mgnify:CR=1 FL=1
MEKKGNARSTFWLDPRLKRRLKVYAFSVEKTMTEVLEDLIRTLPIETKRP